MAFRWRANDGPHIVAVGFSISHQLKKQQQQQKKKRCQSWTPSDKAFWIGA